jgi:Ni,Fe-hydrogenase maturation factor
MQPSSAVAPLLVFGWGNLSRGDDALGPIFVDLNCAAPFQVSALQATHEQSISTHGLSPATVLQVFRRLQGCDPPESTQLAIRGERFELGAAVSESAALHLERALIWGLRWLISSSVGKQASGNPQTQKPTSLLDVGF